MSDYYGIIPKTRGRRGCCLSIFQQERTPSMIIYIDQDRYYDFSSGKYGDSFDLLQMATGKSYAELRKEYGFTPDADTIRRRKQDRKKEQRFQQQLKACWIRMVQLLHKTYAAEKIVKGVPTDRNLSLMSDAFFVREIAEHILALLESGERLKEQHGLWLAEDRGLFDG
ncbi:DNA primase [Sporomusaceae bacterium BoRhaA]|nr:DNA primase [Pelorhabdus rhamnosifermentans]